MDHCIFCQIIDKQEPSTIIYENDTIIAISPKNPIAKGHTLIIPKKHSENIVDTDYSVMEVIGAKLKELSAKLIQDNGATGINILNANGEDAQQSVKHLHFHLVPRYPNDGLDLWIKQKL